MLGEEKCKSEAIKLSDISTVLRKLIGVTIKHEDYTEKMSHINLVLLPKQIAKGSRTFLHPFSELFLWALLCNMDEMAFCLWPHGEEVLAKALIAKMIFQNIAKITEKRNMQEEFVEEFKRNDEKFGVLSVQLLNECFRTNELLAGQLVTYNLENWGQQTCLSLAVASKHLDFVAHSCCQTLLSSRWTGALQFNGTQAFQVLFGLLCPFYIFQLTFRTREELSKVIMTEQEHQDAIEIENKEKQELFATRKHTKEKTEKSRDMFAEEDIEMITQSSSNVSFDLSYKGSTFSRESYTMLQSKLKWYQKAIAFYKAPVTKFWGNVVSKK